jgi:hypothetical protein
LNEKDAYIFAFVGFHITYCCKSSSKGSKEMMKMKTILESILKEAVRLSSREWAFFVELLNKAVDDELRYQDKQVQFSDAQKDVFRKIVAKQVGVGSSKLVNDAVDELLEKSIDDPFVKWKDNARLFRAVSNKLWTKSSSGALEGLVESDISNLVKFAKETPSLRKFLDALYAHGSSFEIEDYLEPKYGDFTKSSYGVDEEEFEEIGGKELVFLLPGSKVNDAVWYGLKPHFPGEEYFKDGWIYIVHEDDLSKEDTFVWKPSKRSGDAPSLYDLENNFIGDEPASFQVEPGDIVTEESIAIFAKIKISEYKSKIKSLENLWRMVRKTS